MINRIIEIAEEGRYLSLHRGFLIVESEGQEIGRIPLADMAGLILSAQGCSLSKNILAEMSERGIIVVICGKNYHPISILWPNAGHHEAAGRIFDQISAPIPLCKNLWQSVAHQKILGQLAVIKHIHGEKHPCIQRMQVLADTIKSGDKDNHEAQAARIYWSNLFGYDFLRDPDIPGINSLLNYGYAILRACVARSLAACGLHPAIGIHHKNRKNPYCLVDDMMEPFRPLVDMFVYELSKNNIIEINVETKKKLATILGSDLQTQKGRTPLVNVIQDLSVSLAASFQKGKDILEFPRPSLPLD